MYWNLFLDKLVYLIDLRPTKNPDSLDYVSEGGLNSQTDSAFKVLAKEVGMIWDRAVRKVKSQI